MVIWGVGSMSFGYSYFFFCYLTVGKRGLVGVAGGLVSRNSYLGGVGVLGGFLMTKKNYDHLYQYVYCIE